MYVWPHLEYAAQSWCPWNVADKEILEKVQRRAINMVSNLRGRTYEEKLSELGMVTLEARRRRRDMIQIFKILSGIDHVQPATWFILENTLVREGAAQTRSTTSNHTIMERWTNTDIRRNLFSQRVIKPWNNLPDQIKSVSSVDIFKNDYDIWFPISKPRMKAFQFHSIIGFSQCFIEPIIAYLHFIIYDPANDLTINYAIN